MTQGCLPIHQIDKKLDPLDMTNMTPPSKNAPTTRLPLARRTGALLFATALALSACGSSGDTENSATADAQTASLDAIALADDTTEPTQVSAEDDNVDGDDLPVVDTDDELVSDAPVTQTTPTTVPGDDPIDDTGTTTPPPDTPVVDGLVVIPPSEIATSQSDDLRDVFVNTSVGDDLNVRSGPGVDFPVVDSLPHQASLTTFEFATLDSGSTWRFVFVGEKDLGWVNASFLTSKSPDPVCVAPSDALTGLEQIGDVHFGDVDGDGADDAVSVYHEVFETPLDDGRVVRDDFFTAYVEFANGGTAALTPIRGDFHPAANGVWGFADLSYLPTDPGGDEIILGLGSGSTTSSLAILTLDDCDLVQTSFDGLPFGFTQGAGGTYSSGATCVFGAHGETTFVRHNSNIEYAETPGTITTTSEHFELRGTQWLLIETVVNTENLDETNANGIPQDCGF